MGYDSVGNVASTVLSSSGGKIIGTSATYDSSGNRLASVTDATGASVTYAYGNAVAEMTGLPASVTAPNGTVTTSTYDENHRVTETGIANTANLQYTYSSGNLSSVQRTDSDSDTQTYGTNSLTFSYDTSSQRTSKTVGSVTHDYLYSGGQLLRETFGNTTLDFFYDANGMPYALKYNGTVYYITNLQGDVMQLMNANGNIVASYDYDPYGKVISATGTMAEINPLRYRGYYDTESGLYYITSRYYDPEIGRWINADDVDYLGAGSNLTSYNLFAYCGNNPVMGYDPTGHWDWGGVIAGLAIFATGTAALALTIATCGAAVPAAALAISAVSTVVTAATISTGIIVTTGAATDATIVSDFTVSVGGERKGISIVTDFKNDTWEVYAHSGLGTSDTMGVSYSTGYVYEYTGQGSYSGDFVEGGISAGGYSISYSQDPNKQIGTGCRAVCFGFSTPGSFSAGASYDFFIPIGYTSF